MVTRAACANSAWLTSTTWATIEANSFSNSESASTAVTTSLQYSSTFTPGAVTIDGIAVKIASRSASPTGTVTFGLYLNAGSTLVASVTVNVSDLPTATATTGTTTPVGTAEGGWFFVNFGSQLLVAATAYKIGAVSSSSSQVNLWATATTNWSRYLRTTTTGNMASGDDAIITKEWTAATTGTARTVTMDETATTDYGGNTTSQVTPSLAICQGGTLTFSTGIAANLRQSGYVIVYNGGTLNIGSSGSEVARGSSAVLQFDCGTDGDFGLVARIGSIVNMYGLSRTSAKNVSQCKLNADAAGGATSITIDTDTGWLSGDLVCLAPTTQTSTQFESKALTGNATATTAAITALANAHSGTSPTQAEVGLLTRNVQMAAVTANVTTFFYVATTAVVNCSWASFRYFGTNGTGKRGIEINTTTGSCTIDYCAIFDADSAGFFATGATLSNLTITNTVIYNVNLGSFVAAGNAINTATSGTWTINNCMFCGSTGTSGVLLKLSDIGGTLTNCSFSGCSATGVNGALQLAEAGAPGTFTNLSVHGNVAIGLEINTSPTLPLTLTTINAWRNLTTGLNLDTPFIGPGPVSVVTSNFFGNATSGIQLTDTAAVTLDTCTFNGDTTFTQTNGFKFSAGDGSIVKAYSCNWSTVAGIKTKCTNDLDYNNINGAISFITDDCILNGTAIYANVGQMINAPFLQAQNFGQTDNDNRTYVANGGSTAGLIQSNSSTVYSPNVLSEQMTPASTAIKLVSQSIFVECASGRAATPVVQVRKNAAYNGAAPRLIVKRQDSIGVTVDTVLDTLSVGADTWEALTGVTVTATQNGVFEFVVDCDGTAGSAFVGDATATTA